MRPLPALSLALLLLSQSAEAAEPWYRRASCESAARAVLSGDFKTADERLGRLEAQRDPDDQACAVWLHLLYAEIQLGLGGKLPALLENRDRRLKNIYGFSKAHAKYAARFADLEIEARMKRVRFLAEDGKRSDALKEAKRSQALLELRLSKKAEPSITLDYSIGSSNLAVAFASWPVRMVIKLAGVSGDGELGAKKLQELYKGDTVYRYEAAYLLHSFAVERPGDLLGSPVQYAAFLAAQFPNNPQFLYEYAEALWVEKNCALAMQTLKPVQDVLAGEPGKWSSRIRGKIYLMSGRCALDLGQRDEARRFADLARSQRVDEIEEKLEDLISKLGS